MCFIKSCRKKIQLKCAYIHSSHFCFAFLHMNFSSCEKKMVWTAEVWGQVECGRSGDGTRKECLPAHTLVTMFTDTSILSWSFAVRVTEWRNEQRRGSSISRECDWELWPWLIMASCPKWGYYIYCNSCPNLCSETRRVVAPCAVWSFGALVAAELADRHGILMPVLLLPKMKTRLLQQCRKIFFSVWYEYHTWKKAVIGLFCLQCISC